MATPKRKARKATTTSARPTLASLRAERDAARKQLAELTSTLTEFVLNYDEGCEDGHRRFLQAFGEEIGEELVPDLSGELVITIRATYDHDRGIEIGLAADADDMEAVDETIAEEIDNVISRAGSLGGGNGLQGTRGAVVVMEVNVERA